MSTRTPLGESTTGDSVGDGADTPPVIVQWARRAGWQALAALTSSVIVFSAARAITNGYEPVNDNALIELRGRDVLTGDHPFLGTWSSASISAGIDVNHPGPLIFDLVALPVRLFGSGAGIAVAVAALHLAVVWAVGWVTFRAGGATAAIVAQAITAGIVWTLGSELLIDPWQPNLLVLPFWLFMCSLWACVAGEDRLFPLACGVGSFAMQTHLGFIVIVPVLLGAAALPTVLRHRSSLSELRRTTLLSIAVIVVLWAQPLFEQFFGPGQGNLSRVVIAGSGGGDGPKVDSTATGLATGIRILGSVLALPPWWGRSGYDDSVPASTWVDRPDGQTLSAPGLRTTGPALLALIVLTALILLAWWGVRKAGNRRVEAGFRVLVAALIVASITVVITPVDVLGLSPHKVRWLWVLGAFATYMLTMAALSVLGSTGRRRAVATLGAVGVIALAATVPTYAAQSGPTLFRETYASISDVRSQVAAYVDADESGNLHRVLFDPEGIGYAEPYTAPVIAELLRSGVDVVVDDATFARQLGPDRAADQDAAADRSVVFVRAGADATTTPDGAIRIAFHDGDRTPYSLDDVTDRAVAVFLAPAGSDAASAP